MANNKPLSQRELQKKKQRQNTIIFAIFGGLLATIVVVSGILLIAQLAKGGLAKIEGYTDTGEVTDYVRLDISYTDNNGKAQKGTLVVELNKSVAPITVANFQKLVSQDFYDGLTFHRIIENFMIQGGDPKGNGSGGSSQTIKGEFNENGVNNGLLHTRGVISMARSNDPDSASSQFFIVHQTTTNNTLSLDGKYAGFGIVVKGIEVVDAIATLKTNPNTDAPLKKVIIQNASFVSPQK